MAATQSNRRVSARVTPEVYETLSEAADLTGATLNQFIVQSAFEKAQEVIERERFIRMTSRSAAMFFEALDHPPKPTLKLRKAARLYRAADHPVEN
ncbi:MAG: DUF1778 domain-containing protein [Thermodesulfobacteriota bacterium]